MSAAHVSKHFHIGIKTNPIPAVSHVMAWSPCNLLIGKPLIRGGLPFHDGMEC